MPLGITLITCTYNPGASFYELVLPSINSLIIPIKEIEYLIIDNNSTTPLKKTDIINRFNVELDVKIIIESNPGLTNARKCAIEHSKFEILLFIDDDVALENDYLVNCISLFSNYSHTGAWNAGSIKVKYLAKNLSKWYYHKGQSYFQESNTIGSIYHNDPLGFFPFGTGLAIKKEIGLRYIQNIKNKTFTLSDRNGLKLTSSGDNQLILSGIQMGFGVGRSETLKLTHIITEEKSNLRYLKKLVRGQTSSLMIFLFENPYYKYKTTPKSYYLKNIIIYILHFIKSFDLRTLLIQIAGLKGVHDGNNSINKMYK